MARTVITKQDLLKGAGYVYNYDREIFFNRQEKKIFSLDFIEDRNEQDFDLCVQELNSTDEWRFYFNDPPSESVKRQLEIILA